MRTNARIPFSCLAVTLGVVGGASHAFAQQAVAPAVPAPPTGPATAQASALPPVAAEHPNPRLKLSYRRFSISNLDDTTVGLSGVQLDVYPLSMRWVRSGLEVEYGGGHAALMDQAFDVRYGLLGLSLGFQYPAVVTPFIEGRVVGGVLNASRNEPLTIPGSSPGSEVTLEGTSVATWMVGRGIDVGAEVFMVGRAYVSLSLGWLRSSFGGIDYNAAVANPDAQFQYKTLTSDSFTLKLGLGI